MAGIYLHIPFCKQACNYCDFHFSTSLKTYEGVIAGILKEISIRKSELKSEVINTIYFGGGTPSQLLDTDLSEILNKIREGFNLTDHPEISLETNPDDINKNRLNNWKEMGINRLSIGIQSFFDSDLEWMNRGHNAEQAMQCIKWAKEVGFNNLTADLIYGLPGNNWKKNIDIMMDLDIPHISSYALMVEDKTVLQNQVQKGKVVLPVDQKVEHEYHILCDSLKANGYDHYEISNFAKPGFNSRHNSAYWSGELYLGIGPAAHSFDGSNRRWNVSNNSKYIRSLDRSEPYWEEETLTNEERFNEYVMTGLRTAKGISVEHIEKLYGEKFVDRLWRNSQSFLECGKLNMVNDQIIIPEDEWFRADTIISDLFVV